MSPTKKARRCPKGTRRNKKTGLCEPNTNINEDDNEVPIHSALPAVNNEVPVVDAQGKRCPKGTRRNKKSGRCEPIGKDADANIVAEPTAMPEPMGMPEPMVLPTTNKTRRCPTGYRKNAKTGICEPIGKEKETEKKKEEPRQQKNNDINDDIEPSTFPNNKELFANEKQEYEEGADDTYDFLYPNLNDPMFNVKIAERKEFNDTKYDGDVSMGIKEKANIMCNAKFELMPHQLFVRNFMSFQTPYNGLLLYHGLGSGKTCSAIGIAEEMRGYMKQVGIKHRIIVVASPNVQGNFRLQLFDERKLRKIPNPNQSQGNMGTEEDIWDLHSCVGNSLLKEINPANIKGLSREKVISQINTIINTYYTFMGYGQFSNFIQDKLHIESPERFTEKEKMEYEIKNIRRVFNNRLVIIDEVQNIRMTDDNNNKKTAALLMKVAKYSENMRLLLLSATPMFNSNREIIWITNLLNLNDKRSTIETTAVFDKDGNYREGDSRGIIESGEALLKRKLTGYISYVRGENPFTFPYRIYPNLFSPEHTFLGDSGSNVYPTKQMNGMGIADPIQHLRVYLNNCGRYQESVYNLIIDAMRNKDYSYQTALGNIRELPSFENMESFGYTLLQTPVEALNMVYPNPEVEKTLRDFAAGKDVFDANAIAKSVGNEGLSNVMKYDDTMIIKHNFKYKPSTMDKYGRIFSPENIGEYSAKIANICDIIKKSNGVVIVYSQYIHGGIIPLALALEEMGFSRYSSTQSHNKNLFQKTEASPLDATTMRTFDEIENKDTFSPAKYIMITGDKTYSPSNTEDIKAATNPSNKNGEKVKVILISKAGSEGLDFKNVRQVHIMEPWYNMNRIEQTIGRAVRNLSHCDLPFEDRNVEIYLHSTMLSTNKEEEAVDLYIYRFAEKKAIQIGKVSRTIKECAVDCILNIAQTNFTVDKLGELTENQKIQMRLSSGKTVEFRVGDEPYSSMCDYMEKCEFTCTPDSTSGLGENKDTYNYYFAKTNNDYIIKKIGELYREKFFYTREQLVREINRIRIYPVEQIYQALTYLLNNKNEYLVDKYGRIGNLINRDTYYVFQPIEISDKDISIYERVVPVDYKRRHVVLEVPASFGDTAAAAAAAAPTVLNEVDVADNRYEYLLTKMIMNYNIVFSPVKVQLASGEKNWYKHANLVIDIIAAEYSIPKPRLEEYVILHMLDLMKTEDKFALLTYLYYPPSTDIVIEDRYVFDKIINVCRKYFAKKVQQTDRDETVVLMTKDNISKLYSYDEASGKWVDIDQEDANKYIGLIKNSMVLELEKVISSDIIGFVNMFTKNNEMYFKIKDVRQARNNVGARCGDSAGRQDIARALNTLLKQNPDEEFGEISHVGLCVLMESLLRWYTENKKDGKIYFFDPEQTYLNKIVEFKKVQKAKK